MASSSNNFPITSEGSESSLDSMNQMPSSLHQHHVNADTSSCHNFGRKKRRGMIEKKRRDRINNSLNDLRRLVPAAFEKQGSAKLEKAEILQMTVDHLTMLHAKGFDAFSFDPHKFAMDYHSIGFRECMTEVSRYFTHVEGMDPQDGISRRVMSHLQCYAAQRELSLKTSAHVSAWNPSAFTTPHQFATPAVPPAPSSHSSSVSVDSYWNPPSISSTGQSMMDTSHHHHLQHHHQMSHGHMMPPPPPSSLIKSSSSPPPHSSSSCPSSSSSSNHLYSSSVLPSASTQYFPTPGYGHGVVTAASGQVNGSSGSVKQFRPWGGELVY